MLTIGFVLPTGFQIMGLAVDHRYNAGAQAPDSPIKEEPLMKPSTIRGVVVLLLALVLAAVPAGWTRVCAGSKAKVSRKAPSVPAPPAWSAVSRRPMAS